MKIDTPVHLLQILPSHQTLQLTIEITQWVSDSLTSLFTQGHLNVVFRLIWAVE
jgi:hypothetical protein